MTSVTRTPRGVHPYLSAQTLTRQESRNQLDEREGPDMEVFSW